jgi:Domain of Unknown Function (DUF1080)
MHCMVSCFTILDMNWSKVSLLLARRTRRDSVYPLRIMRTLVPMLLPFTTLMVAAAVFYPQQPLGPQSGQSQTPSMSATAKPQDTETWEPVPGVVTPGADCNAPPSDAITLFDGKNLDEWVSARDQSPAKWMVARGGVTVNKAAGDIETKRRFRNYQLHLEWKVP